MEVSNKNSINVNRNVSDVFYRYKMPRLQAKVEGKGNGIKTVLVNIVEVARAISRPASYTTKYFGCELGAQIQFDQKNERYIVNGSHDTQKLQDMLHGFIRKFVLCTECDNPETDLSVSAKHQAIMLACKACGFHGLLKVNHKVNAFILKNPPKLNAAAHGRAILNEGKRKRRGGKKIVATDGVAALPAPSISTAGEGAGGDSDATVELVKRRVRGFDDNVTWSVDISKEAIRARLDDLTTNAKSLTVSDDFVKSERERVDIFYELVKKKRDESSLSSITAHKNLLIEAERLDVASKAPLVLAELLFTENIVQELRQHRNLLLRFTYNNPKAQRYLIGGFEQIIALNAGKLMNKVPGIFKLSYDLDIIEETTILDWSQKVSKKYVTKDVATAIHDKVKPFIQWLQEAEEENSTSDEQADDDDDDIEIVYNDRAPRDFRKAVVPAPIAKAAINTLIGDNANDDDDDDGDDINIDDI